MEMGVYRHQWSMTTRLILCMFYTGAYNGSSALGGGFTLFVYNIGTDADERSLWQLFSPFGLIDKVSRVATAQGKQGIWLSRVRGI